MVEVTVLKLWFGMFHWASIATGMMGFKVLFQQAIRERREVHSKGVVLY